MNGVSRAEKHSHNIHIAIILTRHPYSAFSIHLRLSDMVVDASHESGVKSDRQSRNGRRCA